MIEISEHDIQDRMRVDNPWWETGETHFYVSDMRRRAYFDAFSALATDHEVQRAVVLMGPRRVGKTVMLFHLVQKLLASGVDPTDILYLSLDTPLYSGLPLDRLLTLFLESSSEKSQQPKYILFDEIQYLRDWEVHLKSLVDTYRDIRFVASGSAAAALKMKSQESGAGRFTDFLLPPLTFSEYLDFQGLTDRLIQTEEIRHQYTGDPDTRYVSDHIEELNSVFLEYLSYGGYPEVALSESVRNNAERYIRSDIIDAVLLRDIPSLYGVGDVQELNRFFMSLAYNTGQEVTLEALSKSANVSKNTLKKYLEYLEAAFLIKRLDRVDRSARRFQRATSFKVYLTNPSLRAALFGTVMADDEIMGSMVETAILSQWFHDFPHTRLTYARWSEGEVDLVHVDPAKQKPDWLVEVKWSDAPFRRPSRLKSLLQFAALHEENLMETSLCTTRTQKGAKRIGSVELLFEPAATYCYSVGKNRIENLTGEINRQRRLNFNTS